MFFIRRFAGSADLATGHSQDCWRKHVSCFPGVTETVRLPDPWFSRSTWNWLRGRSPRGSHLVIRHEVPLELYSRDVWLRCARRGQIHGRGPCCGPAESASVIRRAA
jgi:hypothetical protein